MSVDELEDLAAALAQERKSTIFIVEINHEKNSINTNSSIMLWEGITVEHIEKIANLIRFRLTQALIVQTELFDDSKS